VAALCHHAHTVVQHSALGLACVMKQQVAQLQVSVHDLLTLHILNNIYELCEHNFYQFFTKTLDLILTFITMLNELI
jgi:hypothetical protein